MKCIPCEMLQNLNNYSMVVLTDKEKSRDQSCESGQLHKSSTKQSCLSLFQNKKVIPFIQFQ